MAKVRSHSSSEMSSTAHLMGGVVHEHVDPAEGIDCLLHQAAAMVSFGNVAWDEQALPASLLDQTLDLGRVLVFVQVGNEKIRTLPREGDRHGASDAGIPAGQQNLRVLQPA